MRVAIVETELVDPLQAAGFRAIKDLQESLARIGLKSKIFYDGKKLRKQIYRYRASAILVSRPHLMAKLNNFKEVFGLPVIFWAADFHSRRQSLGEKLCGAPAHDSFVTALVEKAAIVAADVAVYPAPEEADAVSRKFSLSNVVDHPYFSFSSNVASGSTEREKNLVFIGSSAHEPNVDGLGWFLNYCWPSVHAQFKDTRLFIIGDWEKSYLAKHSVQGVEFLGKISEENVSSIMQSSLIGISPLRFGAGVKRKTIQYLYSGLVTVSTDFGLEGLPGDLDDKAWYRANGQEEFSNAICKILGENRGTENISHAAREYILKTFSIEKFDDRLFEILTKLGLYRR